jgi:hypothetical protein
MLQVSVFLRAAEAATRRTLSGWLTRALMEVERLRQQAIGWFAIHEAHMERTARAALAVALQEATRTAIMSFRTSVAWSDRAERISAHQSVLALEEVARVEIREHRSPEAVIAAAAKTRLEEKARAHAAYEATRAELIAQSQQTLGEDRAIRVANFEKVRDATEEERERQIEQIKKLKADAVQARQQNRRVSIAAHVDTRSEHLARQSQVQHDDKVERAAWALIASQRKSLEQQRVQDEKAISEREAQVARRQAAKEAKALQDSQQMEHAAEQATIHYIIQAERFERQSVAVAALKSAQDEQMEAHAIAWRETKQQQAVLRSQAEVAKQHAAAEHAHDAAVAAQESNLQRAENARKAVETAAAESTRARDAWQSHHTWQGNQAAVAADPVTAANRARVVVLMDQERAAHAKLVVATEAANSAARAAARREALALMMIEQQQRSAVYSSAVADAVESTLSLRRTAVAYVTSLADAEVARRVAEMVAHAQELEQAQALMRRPLPIWAARERVVRVAAAAGVVNPLFLDNVTIVLQAVLSVARPTLPTRSDLALIVNGGDELSWAVSMSAFLNAPPSFAAPASTAVANLRDSVLATSSQARQDPPAALPMRTLFLSLEEISSVADVFFACLSLVETLVTTPAFPVFLHHITSPTTGEHDSPISDYIRADSIDESHPNRTAQAADTVARHADVRRAVDTWVATHAQSPSDGRAGRDLVRVLDLTLPPSVSVAAPDSEVLFSRSSFVAPGHATEQDLNARATPPLPRSHPGSTGRVTPQSPSVFGASTIALFHHWLPSHVLPTLPLQVGPSLTQMVDPSQLPHGLAARHRATRALCSFLIACLECLLHHVTHLESVPLLNQLASSFQRYANLQHLLEQRLDRVPAYFLSEAERDRIRVEEQMAQLRELEVRQAAHELAAGAYAYTQTSSIEEDMEIARQTQRQRLQNRQWAAQQLDEEQRRRCREEMAAHRASYEARQRNVHLVRTVVDELQANYTHTLVASSSGGFATRMDRRGRVAMAVTLAEAERTDRLDAASGAVDRSVADRKLHASLTRMVEENERKNRLKLASYNAQQDNAERDLRQYQALYAAEEERNRRLQARNCPRNSTRGSVFAASPQQSQSVPPAYVPAALRRKSSLTVSDAAVALRLAPPVPEAEQSSTVSTPHPALKFAPLVGTMHTSSTPRTQQASVLKVPLPEEKTLSTTPRTQPVSVLKVPLPEERSLSSTPRSQPASVLKVPLLNLPTSTSTSTASGSAPGSAHKAASSNLSHLLKSLEVSAQEVANRTALRLSVATSTPNVPAASSTPAKSGASGMTDEKQRRGEEDDSLAAAEEAERHHNQSLAVVMMERERALRVHEFAATQQEEYVHADLAW